MRLPGRLGFFLELTVAISEKGVNRRFRIFEGCVIAVVDDRPRHAAENRLDHIKEQSACPTTR